jgi:aspartyl-tRNA(Asn)/glutamyl-tRNA(Gln) amidotransferase subunit B
MKKGAAEFGTRAEIKNMNSFKNVAKAMEVEVERQVELIEKGGTVVMETRSWDADKGITRSMRSKEAAHDYRYFPEPDLVPLILSLERIEEIRKLLPELPEAKRARLIQQYSLPDYDAGVLSDHAELANYFEIAAKASGNGKAASNWVMGDLLAALKKRDLGIGSSPVTASQLGSLIQLIDSKVISGKIAKDVFAKMLDSSEDPKKIVEREGLLQVTDSGAIEAVIDEAMKAHPAVVEEFRSGKEAVLGFMVGAVMKLSKGKANPALVNELLRKKMQG